MEAFSERSKFLRSATYENLTKETENEQEARIKKLLKPQNYNAFFDYYFGINAPQPLADAPCAKFHQSTYIKVFNDEHIIQFRRWFRGAAKSIHTNVGNVMHLKENNKLFFGLLIGLNGDMAKLLLADLQMHLESNERIIKDFGLQMSYGNWSDGEFETMDGRFFKSLGLNQPFRGLRRGEYRPDFASVDDCEDRKVAKNKAIVKERGEKITGDLVKAFHLRRGRLVIPNNYIVKGGLNDYLVSKFKNSSHFDMSSVNLRNKDGSPSWDERYTLEMVDDIDNKTDFFTSQREDYNTPIEEGKVIKEKWLRYEGVPRRGVDFFVGFWDLSYVKDGDYKAYALIGVKGSKMYLLDVFCRQCELPVAVDWHYETLKERRKKDIYPNDYYDATAAQKNVFAPVWFAGAKRNKIFEVPMASLNQRVDKHLRIEATLVNVFFNGTLVINEKLKGNSDWENAKTQLLAFEKGTTSPDDFPDALENAVRIAEGAFSMDSEEWGEPVFGQRVRKGF